MTELTIKSGDKFIYKSKYTSAVVRGEVKRINQRSKVNIVNLVREFGYSVISTNDVEYTLYEIVFCDFFETIEEAEAAKSFYQILSERKQAQIEKSRLRIKTINMDYGSI